MPAQHCQAAQINGSHAPGAQRTTESLPVQAYPKWSDVPLEIRLRMMYASLTALALQWGTSGASILIAYLTPTSGLGYRSASYLLYGGVATVVWFCLLLAMLLSHQAMLLYQEAKLAPSVQEAGEVNEALNRTNSYKRTPPHRLICYAAIFFRLTGKTLALLNAGWLIASSLMEFTGAWDNCWCRSVYFTKGNGGWVVLFKNATDLHATAQVPWSSGLALTLIVCSSVYIFFYFASRRTDDDGNPVLR